MTKRGLNTLLAEVRKCTACAAHLPHGPRPILQAGSEATILIAGQAPGRKVHESGVPFDDPSGDRLREWMGIDRSTFYDATQVAILPMGFCYPGQGTSGDLPPRTECAPLWRDEVLKHLRHVRLTIVLGRFAQHYHLSPPPASVTEAVQAWQRYAPDTIALPHPSPRNRHWIRNNPWFERDVLPALRRAVRTALRGSG